MTGSSLYRGGADTGAGMIVETVALDFIRVFSALEIALIALYLLLFAVIFAGLIAIAMRIPTLLWSPTETTCAVCGDVGWCHEVNGQMMCPTCQMDLRPRKRWWEF